MQGWKEIEKKGASSSGETRIWVIEYESDKMSASVKRMEEWVRRKRLDERGERGMRSKRDRGQGSTWPKSRHERGGSELDAPAMC